MQQEWIDLYVRGEAGPAERRAVEAWVLEDERNLEEVHAAAMAYFALVVHAPAVPGRQMSWRQRTLKWTRAAAAAAAAVIVALGIGRAGAEWQTRRLSGQTMTLSVPAGKTLDVVLPDGSEVCLNAGSVLEYPQVFARRERRVRLAGEAIFDVEHDERHPFVVETFACDVEVLGTRFDVAADAARERFSAALFDGRVKVTDRRSHEEVILRPDERVHLSGGRLCRHPIEDRDEYRWREGIVNIAGLSFVEMMERFERVFGVKIVIKSEKIPEVTFRSGKLYVNEGIDTALRNLQMGCRFAFERDPETNTITIL